MHLIISATIYKALRKGRFSVSEAGAAGATGSPVGSPDGSWGATGSYEGDIM